MLFHAAARAKHIPATGIVTLESSQGSRDVLGTIVAGSVEAGTSGVPVVSHQLRGDALSRAVTRRAVLRIATSLILLRFVFRLLKTTSRHGTGQERRGLVLLRSVEHARHAARVFSGIRDVGALVTPQFTQGNSEQIRASLDGNMP